MSEENTHSRLAPSAAKRWTTCTISPKYLEEEADRIPAEQTSEYAEEGTRAHDYASEVLEGKIEIADIPDDEMRDCVRDYVSLAEKITTEADTVYIEEKVPLFYRPEDRGTIDYGLITDDRVYILDLKYGKGVIVEAKENLQLAIYAMSLIQEYFMVYEFTDDTMVTMTIFQPRTFEGNPVKIWAVKLGELRAFLEKVNDAVDKINSGKNLKFNPGEETCQFCPAKGFCTAYKMWCGSEIVKANVEAAQAFDNVDEVPAEMDLPDVESLTDKQIAAIVTHGKKFTKWMEDVAKYAKQCIESGKPIEGLKVVQGKLGNRMWLDEEAALKLIKPKLGTEACFTKKLISPTQAEKLLKGQELSTRFENRMGDLVGQKPGSPVLVPDSDEREPLIDNNEFEMLD